MSAGIGNKVTRLMPSRCAALIVLAVAALWQAGCASTEPRTDQANLSEVLRNAATDAEKSRDYQRAVRHFETLHGRDKTNPGIARDLARNLRYAGAPQKAIAFLKQTMDRLGRRPELVLELAKSQLAAAFLEDAAQSLAEAEDALPDNWQVQSAWGVYHDRRGDFDRARKAYQKALDLSPNNYAVLNNLALSHALAGNIDQGIETLRKVATNEKSTSLVRQNLALLYGIKGDLDAARRLAAEDLPKDLIDHNLSTYRSFHE